MIPPPPRSTLFPYTTLFRSHAPAREQLLLLPICGSELRLQRRVRSEEHTSELQSRFDLVCRLLLEKKKKVLPSGQKCQRTGSNAIAATTPSTGSSSLSFTRI